MFEDANFEAEIEDLNVADDHYAAILPLRYQNSSSTLHNDQQSIIQVYFLFQDPSTEAAA